MLRDRDRYRVRTESKVNDDNLSYLRPAQRWAG